MSEDFSKDVQDIEKHEVKYHAFCTFCSWEVFDINKGTMTQEELLHELQKKHDRSNGVSCSCPIVIC
jgi:hypothetical protein